MMRTYLLHARCNKKNSQLSADIELYSLLKDLMSAGSVVTIDNVEKTYQAILTMHGIQQSTVSRKQLKMMISSHLPEVEFCRSARPNEPERLCLKHTKNYAIDSIVEHQDLTKEMHAIFDGARVIRQEILKAHKEEPWSFDGSLDNQYEIPQLLKTMLRWIIAGPIQSLATDERNDMMNQSVSSIGQTLMFAVKSTKQVKYQPKRDGNTFRHRN